MLSVHLSNIKSSGIYRFVFDKSEVPSVSPQTMRLVVGYSEKGPFNTITYVKNTSEFKEIYGDISKKLERYGCYFHRLALQCLAKEPILCLNLKKFSPKGTSGFANTDGGYEAVSYVEFDVTGDKILSDTTDIEVEKIFDTTRMWTLSPEAFCDNAGAEKYLYLTATDTKKNSNTIFIRPSLAKGYDITLRDWYNTYNGGEYPEYMESCLDTLVSDYLVDVYVFRGKFTPEVATSSTFIKYFTKSGGDYYVKDYITNAYGEKIDALNALSQVEGSGFLARYTGSLIPYFKNADGSWLSIDLVFNNDSSSHQMMMYLNEEFLNDDYTRVAKINLGGYQNANKIWGTAGDDGNYNVSGVLSGVYTGTDNVSSFMFNRWEIESIDGKQVPKIKDDSSRNNFTYGDVSIDIFPTNASPRTPETPLTIIYTADTSDSKFPINVGDLFIADKDDTANNPKGINLATVISVGRNNSNYGVITFNVSPKLIKIGGTDRIFKYNSKLTAHAGGLADKTFDNAAHKGIYLEGYTYLNGAPDNTKVDGKLKWINTQLEVLDGKGVREALTNGTDVDYRYIVDTFEGLPEDGLRSRLSLLAKTKGNALVISNFPAMSIFAKDPGFTDEKGVFSTKYIAAGSNSAKASTMHISMPSDANGASFIAFYTPLKFNDGGIKITVPSAGLVSNNFMDKYTSRQPYYIVAGPSYGKMYDAGLIGPDFNFTREDLDNLEPMGVNCMVYKPQRGTFINSNQTAKQTPVTALSKINVRELVIYLQDTIADMLQGYQWELNTQTLRDNIKAKADAICEQVKSNGGLYAYNNVCNDTNNTPEVIDNEMVVLSTGIEPTKGAGKMVHELTIYRTGGMSSTITNG